MHALCCIQILHRLRSLHSTLQVNALLDFGNGLARVQALGTHFGAVHDLMTPVEFVGIIHLL